MPVVVLTDNDIRVGNRFAITCQRTLRIPDDGQTYPLPPGLGKIPILRAGEFADSLLAVARRDNAFVIPMFQREALWLGFEGAAWKPNAVKIGAGRINAITGEPWNENLQDAPQNYLVVPDQPWLDGFNVGSGVIRQFVAVPLGSGYSVEAQLDGGDEIGSLRVMVFEPKPGRFPEHEPPRPPFAMTPGPMVSSAGRMGLGAGGKMRQKIYPDQYGIDTWDPSNFTTIQIHLLNSVVYREVTGHRPPSTSISTQTYTEFGLPWFSIYDEELGYVEAADNLGDVRSVRELDEERGIPNQGVDESIEVDDAKVLKLRLDNEEEPNDKHRRS